MANTFQKWYSSGTNTAVGAGDDAWYVAILDKLNRIVAASKPFDSLASFYETVLGNLGATPHPKQQLAVMAAFIDAAHLSGRVYDAMWDTTWMKDLYKRVVVLKEQVMTGLGSPDLVGNWQSLRFACYGLDQLTKRWDGHMPSVGDAIRDATRDIVKAGITPSPILEGALDAAGETAGPVIGDLKTILIIGGAIIGGVLILPKLGSGGGSRVTEVVSKSESQARRVADHILSKGKKR